MVYRGRGMVSKNTPKNGIFWHKNRGWCTIRESYFNWIDQISKFQTNVVQQLQFCLPNQTSKATRKSWFFLWFLCYFCPFKKPMSHRIRIYSDKWLFFVKTHPKWPKDMSQVQQNSFGIKWNLTKMSSSRATVRQSGPWHQLSPVIVYLCSASNPSDVAFSTDPSGFPTDHNENSPCQGSLAFMT